MGELIHSWRSGHDSRVWLSKLVDAMERASRPEIRALACEEAILSQVRAQLSRPASPYRFGASPFSLRN